MGTTNKKVAEPAGPARSTPLAKESDLILQDERPERTHE
jgi:hypothetical protein